MIRGLSLMADHHLVDALHQPFHAVIGEQARDHLLAGLSCLDGGVGCDRSGALQGVGIEAARRIRDSGCACRPVLIASIYCMTGSANWPWNWVSSEPTMPGCLTNTNDVADLVVQHVVQVCLSFDGPCPGVDRLLQAVQGVAHDRGLDKLQVHRLVGNRLAYEKVGRRIRAEDGEGNSVCDFVEQDVGSDGADLAEFSNSVAVAVDTYP